MPNPLLYTPEFLTEKTALEDELFPTRHIIGTTSKSAHLAPQILELLAEPDYYAIVSARVAEVIKLATNAFYATKVTFFNQVYDLCDGLGVDYEMVRASMAMDMMTAAEHLDVHHNGYRGFGGKCLPKDTLALLVTHVIGPADDDGTWEPIDPDKTLIANALSYNNLLRGGKLDRDGG
jgi:UDPglucose 6-dehydrogenase